MNRPTAPYARRPRLDSREARGAAAVLFSLAASFVVAVLTVVFIILKLAHVVSWSWPTVVSPVLLGLVLSTLFAAGLFVAAGVVAFKESK